MVALPLVDVQQQGPRPTRRAVLVAGLLLPVSLLPVAGCTHDVPVAPLPPDPDVAIRTGAVAREQALLSMYDGALAAAGLPPARAAVLAAVRREHAEHLRALTGSPPQGSGSPTTAAATPVSPAPTVSAADLLAAEATTSSAHGAAVPAASRALAALLASLSAAEAAHAVALA